MTPPAVMEKDEDVILQEIREKALLYTPEWTSSCNEDPAGALAAIVAHLADLTINRLNRAPERHFLSFLEMISTRRLSARPARAALTFVPSEGAKNPITVPAATRASAQGTDGKPVMFETEGAFKATPGRLQGVWSANPATDRICDHTATVDGGAPAVLFDPGAKNEQDHSLYIGDPNVLNLSSASIKIAITGREEELRPVTDGSLTWCTSAKKGDVVDWKPIEGVPLSAYSDGILTITLAVKNPIDPVKVNGVESRWIRCRAAPPVTDTRLWQIGIADLTLSSSPMGEESIPVSQVQGIGKIYLSRLKNPIPGPIVDTVQKLLDYSPETLAGRLSCSKVRAGNILEAAAKAYYDKTGKQERSGVASDIHPDLLFCNDIPLKIPGEVYPFGKKPRLQDTLYIASADAFSKVGYTITLDLTLVPGRIYTIPNVAKRPPRLSWEYWDGESWATLGIEDANLVDEITGCDDNPGTSVSKEIIIQKMPEIEPGIVQGKKNYWIRVRLVEGDYGREVEFTGTNTVQVGKFCPPIITGLVIRYQPPLKDNKPEGKRPDYLFTRNNRDFRDANLLIDPASETKGWKPFCPFEPIPDQFPTLYLGFDQPLSSGPFSLSFATDPTAEFQEEAYTRVHWQFCSDEAEWTDLMVLDGTNGFVKGGIVQVMLAKAHFAISLFSTGSNLFWLRAIVLDKLPDLPQIGLLPVTGIYPNTTMAVQSMTVTDEVLGSGTGEAGLAVRMLQIPVVEEEMTVDEAAALSEEEEESLALLYPGIRQRTDENGRTTEFWVPWQEVSDFLSSGKDDRHYLIERTTGVVTFGDGKRGKVPPSGRSNIMATYTTGGGTRGNIAARSISKLHSSVPFIDKVYNPGPSGGGSDAESVDALIARGPLVLKHRNQAVTPGDYEQIALDASREVVRVKVFPAMDENKQPKTGWVTVIIVPRSSDEEPRASSELRYSVKQYLLERAPNITRIGVISPVYVKVSVTATVSCSRIDLVPTVEQEARKRLNAFLHPLIGGPGGNGWAFGTVPCIADLITLLERIEGVEYVKDLSLSLASADPPAITTEESSGETVIAPYALASNGTHEITVSWDKGGSTP